MNCLLQFVQFYGFTSCTYFHSWYTCLEMPSVKCFYTGDAWKILLSFVTTLMLSRCRTLLMLHMKISASSWKLKKIINAISWCITEKTCAQSVIRLSWSKHHIMEYMYSLCKKIIITATNTSKALLLNSIHRKIFQTKLENKRTSSHLEDYLRIASL